MRIRFRARVAACVFLLTAGAGLSSAPALASENAVSVPIEPLRTVKATTDPSQFCPIYPLALPASLMSEATAGRRFERVAFGRTAGLAWLTWSGNPSAPTLERSLVPPGDSDTYVNPDNAADHRIDRNDWAASVPGNVNAAGVQSGLTALIGKDIVLPVWSESRGQGARLDYRVAKFVLVRLQSADLNGSGAVSFDYLRDYRCYNVAPAATPATHTTPEDTSADLVLQATDANGDALTYTVASSPAHGTLTGAAPNLTYTPAVNYFGDDEFTFKVSDGELESALATIRLTVTPVNDAPIATDLAIETDQGVPVDLALSATDIDNASLSYRIVDAPDHGSLSGTAPTLRYSPVATYHGADSFTYVANDGAADSAPATVSIQIKPGNTQVCTGPDEDGDGLLDAACTQPFTPPDPRAVAPPNDPTVSTGFLDSFEFLTGGALPIQRGVAQDTIQAKTAAVLRGRVLDGDGRPLRGALVRVAGRPEFGYTYSRADGYYDLLVNGGGMLHLDFQADGYIHAQRPADAPWQDFAYVDDVALVRLDANAKRVSFSAVSPPQVVRGSVVSDADGERQATLFVPAATEATIELHDGTTRPATSLTLRATEFTVGDNGPDRMPGALPVSSGYTYAVELSADEAIAANARSVKFSKPAAFYLDNFLRLPVGTPVPVGYYDYQWNVWRATPNGRIVKIIRSEGGRAVLDVKGNGDAATPEELQGLGIEDAERLAMMQTYAVGVELWRASMTHLTPYDLNFAIVPPSDARPPNVDDPDSESKRKKDKPDCENGSIIGCQNSSLGEAIPIAGTPFELRYQSDRAEGAVAHRAASLALRDQDFPASLRAVELTWTIAGQKRVERFAQITGGTTFEFQWDGRDAYGRTVNGQRDLAVEIVYEYDADYAPPGAARESFGMWSSSGVRIGVSREGVRLAKSGHVGLGQSTVSSDKLGGWGVDVHHAFDPISGVVALGKGHAISESPTVGSRSVGSFDAPNTSPVGKHESQVRFRNLEDFEVGANGVKYAVGQGDSYNDGSLIWQIGTDGIVRHFAGAPGFWSLCWGQSQLPECGETLVDTPAVRIPFRALREIVVDPNGCVFTFDLQSPRLLRICDGLTSTAWVAPASGSIVSIARSSDGRMFVAVGTPNNWVEAGAIYQIDPYATPGSSEMRSRNLVAGVLDSAGLPVIGYSGNDGPAIAAKVKAMQLAVHPNGTLYFSEWTYAIRMVDERGRIRRIAGRPSPECDSATVRCAGITGDGGPATQAKLILSGGAFEFLADGSLVFNEVGLRRIWPNGLLDTFAAQPPVGCPTVSELGQPVGQPVGKYCFGSIRSAQQSVDGSLLAADSAGVVHRFSGALPGLTVDPIVVGATTSSAMGFDSSGRHLATRDVLTGKPMYLFEYDEDGRLSAIVDADQQRTRIERRADGTPIAIVAPHGQRTELELDAEGNLAVVRNPLRNEHRMSYLPGGLLKTFRRPGAQPSTMTYDSGGRLQTDVDPLAGGWTLDRTNLADGWRVDLTSAEGRRQTYDSRTLPTGERIAINRARDGSISSRVQDTDASTTRTAADGSESTTTLAADPRFGVLVPVTGTTFKTPGGRILKSVGSRTLSLSRPGDPFSLTAWTETRAVNGRSYRQHYAAGTRMLTLTSPMNRTQAVVLDEDARPISLSVPGLASVAYSYDGEGRLETTTTSSDGQVRTSRLGYDSFGFVSSLTDPARRSVSLANDAVGQTKTRTPPDTRQIGFDHDARGNVTGITPPGRTAHVFGYDDRDQLGGYAPPSVPNGGMTDYAYNRDRQLERVTRPDGAIIDPQYETSTGRLSSIATPEGSTAYTWLPGGRVDTISAPGGNALDYGYDGPLLTSVRSTGAAPGTVSYSYDNNLWLDTINAAGTLVDYGYDNDGLLTSAKVGATTLTLSRNLQHGLLEGTTLGQVTDTWSYNGFAEPLSYSAKYGTATQFSATYTQDDLGRIETRSEATLGDTRNEAYRYDLAGRLDTVTRGGSLVSDYGFDDNGNRTEHRIGLASPLRGRTLPCLGDLSGTNEIAILGQYDAQDRMTAYGTCTFEYTANGELTQRTDTATNAVTRYRYDVFGNLRDATLANGTRIEYDIDGRNRRIGKRVNGVRTQGFLYISQLEPIAELNGSGAVVASFVYADRAHVPSLILKNGKTYRIVVDHLGSVRLVVDIATGEIAQRMEYDEYGNVVLDTAPGFQPFGYAGGIYDGDTGLVRFGARDYDPISGRWTAKDPIRFNGGDSNIYGYVRNDPVNMTDPSGLYLGFWHNHMTYQAAIKAGMSEADATSLAQKVVDYDFRSDFDSQAPENAFMHGMCPPGMTRDSCQRHWEQSVNRLTNTCDVNDLAAGIHALQDFYAGGHGLQSYDGLLSLPPSHVYQDSFPSAEEVGGVINVTQNAISNFLNKNR